MTRVFRSTQVVQALEVYHVPASSEQEAQRLVEESLVEYFVRTDWDAFPNDTPLECEGVVDPHDPDA